MKAYQILISLEEFDYKITLFLAVVKGK